MYIEIAIGVAVLLLVYIWWIGVFKSIKVKEGVFRGGHAFYYSFIGSYHKELMTEFGNMLKLVDQYKHV